MYISSPNVIIVPARDSDDDKFELRKIVLGISVPTLKTETWLRANESMEKYANAQGIDIKIANAEFDATKQAAQVNDLIYQGIDILILSVINSEASASMVETAHKAGLKVIAYDRIIINSEVDLFVTFNNTRIGELQAAAIIDKVPRGNYIILSGDKRDENVKFISEGRMEYLKPLIDRRDIKIVKDTFVDDWDPKTAAKIVEEILSANIKIDAILSPNDDTAGAIIQVLEAKGLAGKIAVTGMDGELAAIQRIIQGTQLMTVLKDPRELVKATFDAAVKLVKKQTIDLSGTVNNGKIEVPTLYVTPVDVDKSNIDTTIIKSGYFKSEDVYKRQSTRK